MQFPLSFFTPATIATISISLIFFYYIWLKLKFSNKQTGKQTAPKASGAWPVIGHLRLLGGPELPHRTLASLADNYGPIFEIKIGVHNTLVVSDSNIAKECFTINDKALANRPKAVAIEIMGYNYAFFGLGPYGAYWRKIRKIVMLELLSNTRLEILGHIRISAIKASINDMYNVWTKNKDGLDSAKTNLSQWCEGLIQKMVVRMLFGEWYKRNEEEYARYRKAMRSHIELLATFVISDAVPFLKWLDFGGSKKAMKATAKELDVVLESWLHEHKRKRSFGQVKEVNQDFMGVLMSNLEGAKPEDLRGFDADTVNKATCLTLLSAASDTTSVSLIWALSLLLNNRHVLKNAQVELDVHVGKERQVEDSDLKNLVYLQAIIKETLRLYPAVPLSAPHEAIEECMVGGYRIRKGTRVITNIWKIHRDLNIWSDPDEFRPERFLTTHKDFEVWGQHFELIPFGSGRRMCPGISLALQVLQMTLASLIQGFELATPSDEPVDMRESFGLTYLKANPIEVVFTPRLSPQLYEYVTK